MSKEQQSKTYYLKYIAHILFLAGIGFLLNYVFESTKPIHLQQSQLLNVLLCFSVGYLLVFIDWLKLLSSKEFYKGAADNVPAYLTEKLYGKFPYLFTFGLSNSQNNKTKIRWHKYGDDDVRNKSFVEVYCLHINNSAVLLFLILAVLLPPMIFDQSPPSYLKYIQHSFILFSIYIAFLSVAWLSVCSQLILRLLIWVKQQVKSSFPH